MVPHSSVERSLLNSALDGLGKLPFLTKQTNLSFPAHARSLERSLKATLGTM